MVYLQADSLGSIPQKSSCTWRTSYAGVVILGDSLYVSYYTSDICRDVPWLMGMVLPSDIRIARIPLAALEGLSR
ncbi:MAG: hypothetical protein H5T61_14740 [Thermoflexales bacterium]|nr:hypothetical protein [Thermoflexales bacterium]